MKRGTAAVLAATGVLEAVLYSDEPAALAAIAVLVDEYEGDEVAALQALIGALAQIALKSVDLLARIRPTQRMTGEVVATLREAAIDRAVEEESW